MINFSIQTEYSIDEELLSEHMSEAWDGAEGDLISHLLDSGMTPEELGAEQEYQEVFIL